MYIKKPLIRSTNPNLLALINSSATNCNSIQSHHTIQFVLFIFSKLPTLIMLLTTNTKFSKKKKNCKTKHNLNKRKEHTPNPNCYYESTQNFVSCIINHQLNCQSPKFVELIINILLHQQLYTIRMNKFQPNWP